MHEFPYEDRAGILATLVNQSEPFIITKDGEPVAVVLPIEVYEELVGDATVMRAR